MSFKVVKDVAGRAIAFGPNDDSYAPIAPHGGTVQVLDDMPAIAPPVPSVVDMRQAQLALLAAGLLDAVEAAIAARPRADQITWAKAATVERGDPLIAAVAPGLGLSGAQIDALFAAAAAL